MGTSDERAPSPVPNIASAMDADAESVHPPRSRRTLANTLAISLAVLLALLARSTAFETYHVVSSSMAPSLLPGDHVLVDKLVFGARVPLVGVGLPPRRAPRAGDVLLFRHPDTPEVTFVKRCAEVAGGRALLPAGATIVPEGMLYVLGDNPDDSSDSRAWGFLPEDQVIGRVTRVLWSRSGEGLRRDRLFVNVR